MNKRGNVGVFGLSILVAFVFFMFGMIYVNITNSTMDSMRTDLTCSTPGISSGNMLMCLEADLLSPIFIIGVLSVVMGVITARLLI